MPEQYQTVCNSFEERVSLAVVKRIRRKVRMRGV
jgi:hypothetical protein